jgi:hypothetical protein
MDTFVMLLHDDEENAYVLVSDHPDAPMVVGAQKTRSFEEGDAEGLNLFGWPKEAIRYAKELAAQHSNCPIEYESQSVTVDED